MQSIIDFLIYGSPQVKCDTMEDCLVVLFVLNQASSDFISLKGKCVEYILGNVNMKNALNTIDSLTILLQRE